ncbi:tyrosine-type recombinase/integrase [Methylomonas sp. MgM2]
MSEEQFEQKLKNYYQLIKTQQTDPVTLYLQSLAPTGRRSARSLLRTAATILQFEDELEQMPWNILEYQHLAKVRNTLQEQKKSANTVNLALSALRGVMKACFNLGLISADQLLLINEIKRVRGKRLPSGRSLSAAEIRKLYRACSQDKSISGKRDYALIATLLATGLRRSEIINIRLSDYNTRNGMLTIQAGKGNKQRTAYLNTDTRRIVKQWINDRNLQLDSEDYLFSPITKAGTIQDRKLSSQAVYAIIQQRADQAQIERIRPHDFRRTFVTHLLEAGIDMNTTRQLAGHNDIQTTARYDLRDQKAQRRALQSLTS